MKKLAGLLCLVVLVGCGGGGASRSTLGSGANSVWAGNYSGTSHDYATKDQVGTATMTVSSTGVVSIAIPGFRGVNISASGSVTDEGDFSGTTLINGITYNARGSFESTSSKTIVRLEQDGTGNGDWGGGAELWFGN